MHHIYAAIARDFQNVLTVSIRCGKDGRRLYRNIKEYLLIYAELLIYDYMLQKHD